MRGKGEREERREMERMRAWLFVYTEDIQQAVENISSEFTKGGHDYVVVRADQVDPDGGFPYNLVIPIDAKDRPTLDRVVGQLVEMSGAKSHAVARVVDHAPFLPQEAHCYVAASETDSRYRKPGRYPRSPGENPWG